MVTAELTTAAERCEAFAGRVFGSVLASIDLVSIYIGDRLGYYRALADLGEATPGELALRTGTHERYTREWLEQQAVTGILDVVDTGDEHTRRFSLPAGHDVALTDRNSLSYVAPLAKQFLGMMRPIDALLAAYRTGGGVPFHEYGDDAREGIAEANRVMFINLLASDWIPAMPDIHQRLHDRNRPARIADVGCGTGWSSIAFAQGYPGVQVDGFDLDPASIRTATNNAIALGLTDQLKFLVRDASDASLNGQYDFACAFECIHDMADPVAALDAMRRLVGPGGTVLVGDERVADEFTAPGDDVERLMYGASITHCLAVGMTEAHSACTGTVMRAGTFIHYAAQAGFQAIEILPIENDVWRFYRLTA